jgi:hypothetical protein
MDSHGVVCRLPMHSTQQRMLSVCWLATQTHACELRRAVLFDVPVGLDNFVPHLQIASIQEAWRVWMVCCPIRWFEPDHGVPFRCSHLSSCDWRAWAASFGSSCEPTMRQETRVPFHKSRILDLHYLRWCQSVWLPLHRFAHLQHYTSTTAWLAHK